MTPARSSSTPAPPPVLAALDLGSNTVKLTVARLAEGGALEVVHEDAEITRIGEALDQHGALLDRAQRRTLLALERMASDARRHGAHRVHAVGTAGLRGARNATAFLDTLRVWTGIDVEIIGGLREAELAFRAPASAFGPGPVIVMDLGGRSTELVVGAGGRVEAKISLEIGGVRLTERCLPSDPPTPVELDDARAVLRAMLREAPPAPADAKLVGVSGTILSLAGLEHGLTEGGALATQAEGLTLHRAAVARLFAELAALPKAQRVRGTVLPPGRADIIVAGLLVVEAIMDHYGRDTLHVTGRGVRWGLLYELRDHALAATQGGAA